MAAHPLQVDRSTTLLKYRCQSRKLNFGLIQHSTALPYSIVHNHDTTLIWFKMPHVSSATYLHHPFASIHRLSQIVRPGGPDRTMLEQSTRVQIPRSHSRDRKDPPPWRVCGRRNILSFKPKRLVAMFMPTSFVSFGRTRPPGPDEAGNPVADLQALDCPLTFCKWNGCTMCSGIKIDSSESNGIFGS